MTIKSVLFLYSGEEAEVPALESAMSLAAAHGALLEVLHISVPPEIYIGLYGEAAAFSDQLIKSMEKRNARLAKQARVSTEEKAKAHGLTFSKDALKPSAPCMHFTHLSGEMDRLVATAGRLADIIVIPKLENGGQTPLVPALFDTTRPVLLMPTFTGAQTQWTGKHVALGWDGSFTAARALHAGLGLMKAAASVSVIMVHRVKAKPDDEAKKAIVGFLALHGIEAKGISRPRIGNTTGELLLDVAEEIKADCLVIGGYGHSMLREMVLGGVTQHVLDKATIPVLLAH